MSEGLDQVERLILQNEKLRADLRAAQERIRTADARRRAAEMSEQLAWEKLKSEKANLVEQVFGNGKV